jgi:hypothetical protein
MTINPWSNPTGAGESFEFAHIQRPLDALGMPKKEIDQQHDAREEKNPNTPVLPTGREIAQEDLFPNGGYGWVCVFCVFWINVCTWGISSVCWIFSGPIYTPHS